MLNDKPIKALKYIKGSLVTKRIPRTKKIPKKVYKPPVYNETLLSGHEMRPRKKDKDNPGDQISGGKKDKSVEKQHCMGSRLDAKNFSQIDPIANMMEEVKYTEEEYTGERNPG